MHRFLILIFLIQMLSAQKPVAIDWKKQAEFTDFPENLGMAGMAAAKTENGFIIAGGANFPDQLPWEGGKKVYSDKIFFWNGTNTSPENLPVKLKNPAAYFGYTTFNNQLAVAGGETASGTSKEVFLISKDKITSLPDLPVAITSPAMIQAGNKLYLAGGDTAKKTENQFLIFDFSVKNAVWQNLPDLPVPLANAAIFFAGNRIFVASGRSKNQNGISTLNSEIFSFDLKENTWKKETDILVDGKKSPFVAPAFFTWKNRYLIFAGGDDGQTFHKIETFLSKMAAEKDAEKKEQLTREKNFLVKHHQGFNNKVLIYDIETKKWLPENFLPFPAQVTTAAVQDGKNFYIFSGETRPGIRTPKILMGTVK